MINRDTFCIAPWVEVRINSDGSLNFCDYAKRTDLITTETLSHITVDEYFSSAKSILDARDVIASGNSHSRCQHCLADECITDIGFRHRHNLKAGIFPGDDFEQSLQETQSRYIGSKPKFYHVSFSNSCNMACVMCEGFNSSLLARDLKRAGLIATSSGHDWTTGPAWDNFLDHLLHNPDIVCLHIMGGEPLYHKKFKELLQFLVDNNHTDYHFTFVTNGTVYNKELIDLLEHFTGVQVEISLESFARSNDYIRYPSNTPEIEQNIVSWLSHRSDRFDVVLRTVPQLLSMNSYDTVMDFCLEHDVIVDSNILNKPAYFQAGLLPDHVKHSVREKMKKYTELDSTGVGNINIRNKGKFKSALANHAGMVMNVLDVDYTPEKRSQLHQEMTRYLANLDRVRNTDVREYFPELADLFNSNDYEQHKQG